MLLIATAIWMSEDPTRTWDQVWNNAKTVAGYVPFAALSLYFIYALLKRLDRDEAEIKWLNQKMRAVKDHAENMRKGSIENNGASQGRADRRASADRGASPARRSLAGISIRQPTRSAVDERWSARSGFGASRDFQAICCRCALTRPTVPIQWIRGFPRIHSGARGLASREYLRRARRLSRPNDCPRLRIVSSASTLLEGAARPTD
jgi:hypothetical protein